MVMQRVLWTCIRTLPPPKNNPPYSLSSPFPVILVSLMDEVILVGDFITKKKISSDDFSSGFPGKIVKASWGLIPLFIKEIVVIWPEIGHNYCVAYRIVFTENAIDDFNSLDARWRATIRDAIRVHLTHEPTKQSRSRLKRLRDFRHPQFRLMVGAIRIFYDVVGTDVVIMAIMSKEKTIQWLKEHGVT